MSSWKVRLRGKRLAAVVVGAVAVLAGASVAASVAVGAHKDGHDSTASRAARSTAASVTITDMAGRRVTIPKTIHKVFGTSPMAAILIYTLNPKQLLAWNYKPTAAELEYLVPSVRKLRNLSGWYAGNVPNPEAVIAAHPDFILDVSMAAPNDPTTVSRDDKLQSQLNIPFVVVDGRLDKLAKTYAFVGRIMGDSTIAKAEGQYVTARLRDVRAKAAKIPAGKRKRVYYAEGNYGLNTEPVNSPHAEILAIVGARNVAANVAVTSGAGMTPVSLEQVLAWNPDWIIIGTGTGNGDSYSLIKSGKNGWSAISAVRKKNVYAIPELPFTWFDRPPSVNEILGITWAAELLYPSYYRYNTIAETQRFFKLFYHVTVTTQQVQQILARSVPRR
jgi:iron complex transport system substrate-binding protein